MYFRGRTRLREMGAAFALLAMYILVLLAPLHQAAGLQRDLNVLGFTALDTWSICTPLAQTDDGDRQAVGKCAAAGIGKNNLALPVPASVHVGMVRLAVAADFPVALDVASVKSDARPGQPRAPPVSV